MTAEIHKGPDGLEEYDNPLPRWWLYLFYFTILFAIGYCYRYPSFWFWNGTENWSQESQYKLSLPKGSAGAPTINLTSAAKDPANVEAGKAVFAKNCAVCHGDKGEGKIGPSLIDKEWKYGGTDADIVTSIQKGRPAGMPAWGKTMKTDEITKVGAFVRSLSPQP